MGYQNSKRNNKQVSSKLIDQDKHIYTIDTSFEEQLDNMSISNRVAGKIESYKLEPETTLKMKLDEIKAYHMEKSINLA